MQTPSAEFEARTGFPAVLRELVTAKRATVGCEIMLHARAFYESEAIRGSWFSAAVDNIPPVNDLLDEGDLPEHDHGGAFHRILAESRANRDFNDGSQRF